MSWLISILISVLTGVVGLLLTGVISNACVAWYRISSFEGKAGYFVVFTALAGGVAAAVIGLVTARVVAAGVEPGFVKGLGYACGVVIALAGLAAVLCRLLADIPPEIAGQELDLEVEFRLPASDSTTPPTATGEWSFTLGSVVGHTQRASRQGEIQPVAARREGGHWLVPAKAYLFTRRGQRTITLVCDGKLVAGFLVPLPARPGLTFEQWSEWLPRQKPDGQPWPADQAAYRFRVVRQIPPPPEPDPAVVEAEQFAALKSDAPLLEWLNFLEYETPADRVQAIMQVVDARAGELLPMIQSADAQTRERALTAVPKLAVITPELGEILRAEGKAIVAALARFNQMPTDDPRFYDLQMELNSRFTAWKYAWWTAHRRLGWDGRPPVQEIHDLALVRAQGTRMDEIVVNARAILDALEPKPTPAP